jgi:cardiolipin synthase A/B
VNRTTGRLLTPGDRVEVLIDGDEAYPAMVYAIEKAEQSISLCTYIFDRDKAGMMFSQALADAVAQGVEMRVLVDDAGAPLFLADHSAIVTARGCRVPGSCQRSRCGVIVRLTCGITEKS